MSFRLKILLLASAIGFGALLLAVNWVKTQIKQHVSGELQDASRAIAYTTAIELKALEAPLAQLANVVNARGGLPSLTQNDLDSWVEELDLLKQHPSIKSISIARYLTAQNLQHFQRTRPDVGFKATTEGDALLVTEITPFRLNRAAIGTNNFLDPYRRAATKPIQFGRMVSMSAPLQLKQLAERHSYLLFGKILALNGPLASHKEAPAAGNLWGTVAFAIDINLLVNHAASDYLDKYQVQLNDVSDGFEIPLFQQQNHPQSPVALEAREQFTINGRNFALALKLDQQSLNELSRAPLGVMWTLGLLSLGLLVVCIDQLIKRKERIERLRSQQRYLQVNSDNPYAAATLNAEMAITAANSLLSEWCELGITQLLDKRFESLFCITNEGRKFADLMRELTSNQWTKLGVFHFIKGHEQRPRFEISAIKHIDPQSESVHYALRIAEHHTSNENLIAQLLGMGSLPAIGLNTEQKIVWLNAEAQNLFHYESEVLDQEINQIFEETSIDALRQTLTESKEFSKAWNEEIGYQELIVQLKNERVSQRVMVLHFPKGSRSTLKFLVIFEPRFETPSQDQALRRLVAEIQSETELKTEFLNRINHEFRTPLNIIKGCARLIAMNDNPESIRSNSEHILFASNRLATMLEDALNLNQDESKSKVSHTEFLLEPWLAAEGRKAGLHNARSTVVFNALVSPALRYRIADHDQIIKTCLARGIDNAFKFTEDGQIIVQAEIGIDQALKIHIADTGCGVRLKTGQTVNQLFEPFGQGIAPERAAIRGLGLGLSVVKREIERIGGKATLTQADIGGSQLTLVFPSSYWKPPIEHSNFSKKILVDDGLNERLDSEQHIRHETNVQNLDGLRILVADDVKTNCMILENLLTRKGAKVTCAYDGEIAFRSLQAAPTCYDLILTDLDMPNWDGYRLLREIRNTEGLSHLPVVAVTGGNSTIERERCMRSGFNLFMSKPYQPLEIFQVVDSLTDKQHSI